MRKLKRITDGKVYDCNIVLDCCRLKVVYYDDAAQWTIEPLENFVPAIPGLNY